MIAYDIGTFHPGTNLVRPEGARYTIHVSFRSSEAEWASRISWADHSHEDAWYGFVAGASLRQLLLFGFPPPGHEFWDQETLEAVSLRYPGLDVSIFRA